MLTKGGGLNFIPHYWRIMLASATKPLASNGKFYNTIQLAVTGLGGSGWIYVPSGTWSESVSVSQDDVLIFGAGWSTIIDGGTTGHAIAITGDRVTIRDLQAKTTGGQGNDYDAINIGSTYDTNIDTVYIPDADREGIRSISYRAKIRYCYITGTDSHGILAGRRTIIHGGSIIDPGLCGVQISNSGDNSQVIGTFISGAGDDGIFIDVNGENCVVDGNRITGSTNEDIDDDSGTSTIGDNDTT